MKTIEQELKVLEQILEFARDAVIKNLTADVVILDGRVRDLKAKYEGQLVAAESRHCVDMKSAKVDTINAFELLMIKEFPKLKKKIQRIAKKKRYAEQLRREAGIGSI